MVFLPTRRLLAAAIGGALLIALGSLAPAMLFIAALYLLCLVVLVVVDFRLSPPSSSLDVTRQCEARLSLDDDNQVELRVKWHGAVHTWGGRAFRLWVRDESPVEIEASRTVLEATLRPGEEWLGRYTLRPDWRGDYHFGSIHVRLQCPLGLLIRQHSFPRRLQVKVYPNLQAVRRYDLLARRGRLQETGLRRSLLFGAGTEFERLRDYQPDDDYRRIAWKATARRGQPVTVQYETERSQNLVIMLDTGRLMATPVGRMQKLDYAVNAALMLSYMAGKLDDRVGFEAFSDWVEIYLPPRKGRSQFHLLLETLYKVHTQSVESDPPRALAYLASRQSRRSLIVLFTDLEEASGAATLATSLSVLAKRHLVLCVTVADPTIYELARAMPTNSRFAYEKVVAQRLLDERRTVLDALEKRGVLTVDVPAEKLTAGVVNQYLEIKARTKL